MRNLRIRYRETGTTFTTFTFVGNYTIGRDESYVYATGELEGKNVTLVVPRENVVSIEITSD